MKKSGINKNNISKKILIMLCIGIQLTHADTSAGSNKSFSSITSSSGYVTKVGDAADDAENSMRTLDNGLSLMQSNIRKISNHHLRHSLTRLGKEVEEESDRAKKRLDEIINAAHGLRANVDNLSSEIDVAKRAFAKNQDESKAGSKPTVGSTSLDMISSKVQGLTKFLPGGELLGSLLGSGAKWFANKQSDTSAVKNASSEISNASAKIHESDTTLERVDELDDKFVEHIKKMASILDGVMIQDIDNDSSDSRDANVKTVRDQALKLAQLCRGDIVKKMRTLALILSDLNQRLRSHQKTINSLQEQIDHAKAGVDSQNQAVNVQTTQGILGKVLSIF